MYEKKPLVFITGASKGIGRATALRFSCAGYPVAINSARHSDLLFSLQKEILSFGESCIVCQGNVGDAKQVSSIFHSLQENPPGILINNAGIAHIGLFQDMTDEEYTRILNTNFMSVLHCCHAAIPFMLQRHAGSILNISSVWGVTGASCEAVYSAAKGAVNSFTKALGKELAPSGIRVNALACGVIDTEMNASLSVEERRILLEEIPSCRFGTPEETADLIFDLAVHHPYLTGQVISFDGAWI